MAFASTRPRDARVLADDAAIRTVGAIAVLGIALIHFLDLFDTFGATPYIGVLYLLLIAGCVASALLLLASPSPTGWRLGGLLAGLALVAYIASRSIGLPTDSADIGNWEQPLGLASLFVEALTVMLAGLANRVSGRSGQGRTVSGRG